MGLGWMLALVLTDLIRKEGMQHPSFGWSLVMATLAWGTVMATRQLRLDPVDPLWVTVGDTALASFALLAPGLADSTDLFYGGFPAIVVVCAAARSWVSGWAVAAVLSVVTIIRFKIETLGGVLERLSSLISYLMLAGIVGWAVHVIYRTDDARHRAEEARARAEEHGRVATHLHDSVLQTLALIQRESANSNRVAALARTQERELRDWLYGAEGIEAGGLAEAVRKAAAEIEDFYGVNVDVVTVGDSEFDTVAQGIVLAAREAMVNAAKHSGDISLSVYVEAAPERVRVFIRDRGIGFEAQTVSPDRRGLQDSIHGRLSQLGGTAEVRTAPGQGTEIRLEVIR